MDWYDPEAIDNEEDITDEASGGAVSRFSLPCGAWRCHAVHDVLAPAPSVGLQA